MKVKDFINEIEKRTGLTYDKSGDDKPDTIYKLGQIIDNLKLLEHEHKKSIEDLRKKVKTGVKKGDLYSFESVALQEKKIVGNIYFLGERVVILGNEILGNIIG